MWLTQRRWGALAISERGHHSNPGRSSGQSTRRFHKPGTSALATKLVDLQHARRLPARHNPACGPITRALVGPRPPPPCPQALQPCAIPTPSLALPSPCLLSPLDALGFPGSVPHGTTTPLRRAALHRPIRLKPTWGPCPALASSQAKVYKHASLPFPLALRTSLPALTPANQPIRLKTFSVPSLPPNLSPS